MGVGTVLVVTAGVFLWGVLSARLQRADLTGPVVFVVLGAALAGAGLVDDPSAPEELEPLVEITLVWVLFSDAAQVRLRDFRRDLGAYARLLGVGLPLTVLAGWGLAGWLLPGAGVWVALLVGAALAPTDAALGLPVVTNPAVPARVRRLLTVESGLNDGIVTPVVMLALAGAASAEGVSDAPGLGAAALELAVGVAVGAAVGAAGGRLLRWARDREWTTEDMSGVAVLALAVAAYCAALVVDGNGFVAAFCGGLAFGATAGRRGAAELAFLEQSGALLALLVWLTFGAIAIPIVVDRVSLEAAVYAVLSLTLVRIVPVWIATLGAGLGRGTVLFVGWFGPRGLASLVFALLALDELGSGADEAVTVIGVTVLMSVVAHGLTAGPLAARYGRADGAGRPGSGDGAVSPGRRRPGRGRRRPARPAPRGR
jgi:NhaP-type Na+/H+ or K+/H+ antiporter